MGKIKRYSRYLYLDLEVRVLGTRIVKIRATNLYSFLVSSCYQQFREKLRILDKITILKKIIEFEWRTNP